MRAGRWIGCFVYADGCSSHSQSQQLTSFQTEWGRWWPCLVALHTCVGVIPFYCPALAVQRSRPWTAHSTRLGVESTTGIGQWPVPQSMMPPTPPPVGPPPSQISIEELHESDWEIEDRPLTEELDESDWEVED